jgi:hypothetical protein
VPTNRAEGYEFAIIARAETDEGFGVTIRRSKTDHVGHGATIAIIHGGACCPVKAVKARLATRHPRDGIEGGAVG